jgi:glycine/D-amino acid oxidase-like deaminating enzyme
VVIIGGGVIGCSVAYHLAKLGWRDVVLLERKDLTSGTTWHAAGLVVSGTFTSAVMSDTDDLLAGFFCPDDARVNPVDATMALVKGARMGGALILEDTKVTAINQKNGRVTGIVTDKGEIEAEYVVNCGGMWGRELGKMAGVNVPLHAAEHYYLITEPIEGIHRDLPILDDPARFAYYREETGGLMIGLFEPVAAPWGMKGIPESFKFDELAPDWDRMIPHLERAMERIPVAETAGVPKFFCGPESFTPDLEPLMGEAPELKNYYVAAGFNSLGILLGGGVGQVMAQWIVDGIAPIDISDSELGQYKDWHRSWIWPEIVDTVKRDISWSAIEAIIGEEGFFTEILATYRAGRWPCAWCGKCPEGQLVVL